MTGNSIHILLVEDEPGFSRLMEEWLNDSVSVVSASFSQAVVSHEENLKGALAQLSQRRFDVLLADLNLPDSQGLATFDCLYEAVDAPIVVLSGLDDESLAVQAVRRGAQDYLVKGRLDGELLARAIRYAMERSALQQELERARQEQQKQRERASMARFQGENSTTVAAQMLGVRSLKEGLPDVFSVLVARFRAILLEALEIRTHKVDHDLSSQIKRLAEELGVMKGGPRDVVDVYMVAVAEVSDPYNLVKNRVLNEEGRLLAMELMGYLVAFYRPYALGSRGQTGQRR